MVYVIRMEDSNYFKIGYTADSNISTRLKNLQTGCPFPLNIHRIFPHGDPSWEVDMHRYFAESQTTGEWFNLSPEDALWLASEDLDAIQTKVINTLPFSTSPPTSPKILFTMRMDTNLLAHAKQFATDHNTTLSELVRYTLRKTLYKIP